LIRMGGGGMSKKRWALVIGVVVVLGSTAAFKVAQEKRKQVMVQTRKVERQDLTSIVSASAEVKPKRYVTVSANVSGRLTRRAVKEGARVKRGQLLATIDSTRFEADTRQSVAAVQAAQADLDRSRADLDVAHLNFERTQRMHGERLVSDQVMDQASA